MTMAIMQPYFFPYIGYFQLIANSNKFIFFDVVKYNKKSWMNRNRILHQEPMKGFQYISIPIKKHLNGTLISKVLINNEEHWEQKILGQLTIYKKLNAQYYDDVLSLLKKLFEKRYETFLELSMASTILICDYLNIQFDYEIASNIEFDQKTIHAPGDWALAICKSLDVKKYINPYGGYEIFDEKKYLLNGVDIKFIKAKLTSYKQSKKESFEPGLSIIDVMMFNSKEDIIKMLYTDYTLLTKQELENKYED